jgi:DNA invertase Pin-like site-specific DNA recombinase
MKFPIDLSMLTEEEIDQFRQDPSTLFEGDTDVSLYLRFSSERQREQSIEGQLRDCRSFCKVNRYRIAAIYVDRATTARKDVEKRIHFQEMIRDSEKKPWKYVIVWKLDRFARNRTDSALFKFRLRKNGVRVISATEAISEKPEGIILEAVLEGMAEFYSADLSQKITRGMRESALKCHSIGGHVPLGYKIEDHKLVVDPNTAHIVQEAFQLYANGETVAEICRMFNTKGYRTAKGAEFNRNSFKSMFRNERYIGVYTYRDIRIEGGVPAIIDKELFETVSHRLSVNAEAPARGKAKVDYLLAGKLFCGHCGGSMNGESGTSKTRAVHNYYTCYSRKRHHSCDKRPLKKEWIERIVAQDAMELMTDEVIEELADMAMAQTDQDLKENTRIPELTERKKEIESGIANITKAIEKGIASDSLMERLVELEKDKKKILRLLEEEEKYVCRIDREQIIFWLEKFKGGNLEDEGFRRIIIDLIVNSVTVWDEPDGFRITTAYNLTSCKNKTYRVSPSSGKGFGFEGSESTIKSREIKRFRGFLQLFGEIYMDANRAFPANFGDFREY